MNLKKYGPMNRIWLLLWMLMLMVPNDSSGQDTVIPLEALREDFHLFRSALEEAHPGLYRYATREHMDSLFNGYEEGLQRPATQRAFYQSLLPLVDAIQCGHTKWMPSERKGYPYFYYTDRLFPLKLFIEKNRAFVIDFYVNVSGIDKGDEVISINGEEIPVIIDRLLGGIFSDGENNTLKYYELNRYFSAWYADMTPGDAPPGKEFTVRVLKNGLESEITLEAATLEQVLAVEEKTEEAGSFNLSFEQPATAVLTIPYFWNAESGPGFKKFLKQSFHEIIEKNTEHLIIDLRNNEGGKEVYGSLLLSYLMDSEFPYYDRLEITQKKKFTFSQYASVPLAFRILKRLFKKSGSGMYVWHGHKNCGMQEPRKNNYTGKVYVLINGGSFSVSTEFASVLQSLDRAVFIGEETGGGYYGNNSGFFAVVILPHSKLELGIPLIGFYSSVKPVPRPNRGIFPDYEVSPSLNGVLNNRDEVLEFTQSLIEQQ